MMTPFWLSRGLRKLLRSKELLLIDAKNGGRNSADLTRAGPTWIAQTFRGNRLFVPCSDGGDSRVGRERDWGPVAV